jgi:hypothetical protein
VTGAVIRKNEISMTDSCCGAISIFDSVSSSTISHNTLLGSAAWAVGLVPTLAHAFIFSHTRDKVWRGPSGTVVDFGVNNVFVGCRYFRRSYHRFHAHGSGGSDWPVMSRNA